MAAFKFARSVGFATVILLVIINSFLAAQELHVKPGDDVTLPCSAGDGSIRAVEWTRPDLKSPEYVLYYSDGHSVTSYQHPSFKGRVDLADREMKDGNVSLVLKNVSSSDRGTYKCRVAKDGPSRRKRANIETDPISIIQLEVTASGTNSKNTMDGNKDTTNSDGNKRIGLPVGLTVVVLICSAVVVVVVGMFLWKKRRHTDSKSEPAADEAVGDQLL